MYRVCIVDDEIYVQKSILLRMKEFEKEFEVVGIAGSGAEAMELYRALHPDLFFVDIDMPDISGLEFIEKIRKSEKDYQTKFIIISGYDDFAYMRKAIQYGVTDYIKKPILQSEFTAAIRNMYDQFDWERGAEKAEEAANGETNDVLIPTREHSELTNKVVEYLEKNYREEISLSIIARQFFVVPTYLARKFKEEKECSVMQYLEQIRMQKACELLSKTTWSITEIAQQVGYHDSNYFTRNFGKMHNITPREYRKRHRLHEKVKDCANKQKESC